MKRRQRRQAAPDAPVNTGRDIRTSAQFILLMIVVFIIVYAILNGG